MGSKLSQCNPTNYIIGVFMVCEGGYGRAVSRHMLTLFLSWLLDVCKNSVQQRVGKEGSLLSEAESERRGAEPGKADEMTEHPGCGGDTNSTRRGWWSMHFLWEPWNDFKMNGNMLS